jgi:hypothetical protein
MEILIPYDSTVSAVVPLVRQLEPPELSNLRLLDLGTLQSNAQASSARGKHELIDRRRAHGLKAARGEFVAILEDRGVPRSDWAATVVRLHRTHSNAAIGGAVENGCDRILNWAAYFCDFGRYRLPFPFGPRRYLSDVNVSYKRQALDDTRQLWHTRYHEPLVHWALERAGHVLVASPDLVVDQVRGDLTLKALVSERFAWGRLFGSIRRQADAPHRRLWRACLAPAVPLVLFWRFLRHLAASGPTGRRGALAAPAVLVLLCVWSAGELVGYLRPDPQLVED